MEQRRVDPATGQVSEEPIPCVLLDSVQSQANRMELALLDAWEREQIVIPVVSVDFRECDLPKPLKVTSLEAPHRIADAILRDSLLEGKVFRKSPLGKRLDDVSVRNATTLLELCPTSLVFGLWDSTGPRGGLGAKFARAMVSEIVGVGVVVGTKTSSRLDPTQVLLGAGPLYRAKEGDLGWTLEESEAVQDKKKAPVKLGKDGKPSEANHGNVTPSFAQGGVTLTRAVQTTVLSLTALRRLRFPLDGQDRSEKAKDDVARTALAALALCAAVLDRTQGCDLRSRCQLFPVSEPSWELLDRPGEKPFRFTISESEALDLLNEAVRAVKKAGLPWREAELVLQPSLPLAELVRRSQNLAASQRGEEGED